ncbi:hypothetical protein CBFG_02918 [Clostridiales bacterium 1_7_47FAA]|nr:hypothetical protein CBFG_02918 [Clostridiales bacterium 1_7_47FAA]
MEGSKEICGVIHFKPKRTKQKIKFPIGKPAHGEYVFNLHFNNSRNFPGKIAFT